MYLWWCRNNCFWGNDYAANYLSSAKGWASEWQNPYEQIRINTIKNQGYIFSYVNERSFVWCYRLSLCSNGSDIGLEYFWWVLTHFSSFSTMINMIILLNVPLLWSSWSYSLLPIVDLWSSWVQNTTCSPVFGFLHFFSWCGFSSHCGLQLVWNKNMFEKSQEQYWLEW